MKKSIISKSLILAICFVFPFALFGKVTEVKLLTNAHCEGCKTKIEKALKKVDGVQEATLDLPSKVALVKFDDEKTKVENLVSALEKVGYTAQVYEEGKEYNMPKHQDDNCKDVKKSDDKGCCKDKKTKSESKQKK
jgi:copper chaperone CopZ